LPSCAATGLDNSTPRRHTARRFFMPPN